MVRLWFVHGPFMVRLWFVYGSFMVRLWFWTMSSPKGRTSLPSELFGAEEEKEPSKTGLKHAVECLSFGIH